MIAVRRIQASPAVRFWRRVDATAGIEGCWEFIGHHNAKGYPVFSLEDSRITLAHRYAYEVIVGRIPEGLELDHTCRNRGCVNPAHLEAVTHAENVRRGLSGEHLRSRTHCPKGHPYSGENLALRPNGGGRYCRSCRRTAVRTRRLRLRALAGFYLGGPP